jgi:uncharacterized protein (DUF1810 family)
MNKKTRIFILFTIIILFSLCIYLCSCKKHASDSDLGSGSATRIHKVESHSQQSYRLERFLNAQTPEILQNVENELKQGCKTSHWIWYIFPQLKNLGSSDYSIFYGIESLDEAREYLKNHVLRTRLVTYASYVLSHASKKILIVVFSGKIDAQKFTSSMTLFTVAAYENQDKEAGQIFANALSAYKSTPDISTLNILGITIDKFNSMIQWANS